MELVLSGVCCGTSVPSVIGRTLSHYRIDAKLGEGGMGVVYRAVDVRLNRPVAIKVLPPDAVARQERKQRFVQEAKTASALNHPGICHVYDVGQADGVDFIAMEYVDGITLDAFIRRRKPGVSEAVALAVQTADAIAAAHAAGIVHRDIKPGNIIVSAAKSIKVLDFGLAKLSALDLDDASEPTRTSQPHTEQGMILGTAAYMSPEQAEGRAVDTRSDIFSFGAVLYEMLAGRRAFEGTSSVSTLAALIERDPTPLQEIAPAVPPELARLVARCLRKEPQQRLQLMADVKLALEDIGAAAPTTTAPAPAARPSRSLISVALAGLVLGAGATFWLLRQASPPSPVFAPFVAEAAQEQMPTWSPDGKTVAYLAGVNGVRQVHTRSLDSMPAVVTKAKEHCDYLFWHPEGTQIYYTSERALWRVAIAGGAPQRLIENVRAGSASPDGKTILFVRETGSTSALFVFSIQEARTTPYGEAGWPKDIREGAEAHFSPDGSKVAVVLSQQSGGGGFEFWILPFPSGAPKRVLPSLSARAPVGGFSWMPDSRRLVFSTELADLSGRHLYIGDTESGDIISLTPGTGHEAQPAVSPDGTKLAFVAGAGDADLIEISLDGRVTRPVLATTRNEQSASWSPKGGEFAYASNVNGAFEIWARRKGEGWPRTVVSRTQDGLPLWFVLRNLRFSPEGNRIAYELLGPTHAILISPGGGGRQVQTGTGDDQHGQSWSPDGNQIAYCRQLAGVWALVRSPVGSKSETVIVNDVFSDQTDWSRGVDGGVIAFSPSQGDVQLVGRVLIVSLDGKNRRIVSKTASQAFGFSQDGALLYVIRRGDGRWELASIDVRTGREQSVSTLSIPSAAAVVDFSLNPDGRSFITTVTATKTDIWLMHGLPSR